MKRRYKILLLLSYIAIVVSLGTVRASALTEAEVQAMSSVLKIMHTCQHKPMEILNIQIKNYMS